MIQHLPLLLAQTDEAPPAPFTGPAPTTPTPAPAPGTPIEAQDGAPLGPTGAPAQPAPGPDMTFMWILFGGILLFWLFIASGQRKEKRKRAAMLTALKKGDKVQTIGGVLGTVMEVRDNEIVVKVDENSNTRMRFARSAVQAILEEKPE
jgi:preprotein translocase subunit YajC